MTEDYMVTHVTDLAGENRRLRNRVAELEKETEEYRAVRLAYQDTPKQWSTAQAPTLEAIAHTMSLHAAERRIANLEAERAPMLAAVDDAMEWMGELGMKDGLSQESLRLGRQVFLKLRNALATIRRAT